jgi:hypothetical protein
MVATATAAQQQHSTATTTMTPSCAGPEAMLEAARDLLHNPLGLHASPSATEQWRHDVDQLIVTAINTPPREDQWANHPGAVPSVAHSRTPTPPRVPPTARAAIAPRMLATSIAAADLQAKLEHHRSGEDSSITIEHH